MITPNPNLGRLVAQIWEDVLRESPDPFEGINLFNLFSPNTRSYRELLDYQRHNCFGELIPRIVTVRRNIRRLGDPHLPPSRIP